MFSFLLIGCPSAHSPPKKELCTVGDNGYLLCNDTRLKKNSRDYFISISEAENYLCTNPDDYNTYYKWVQRKITELKECRKSR